MNNEPSVGRRPVVFAVVVTFNSAAVIEACLASLANSTYPLTIVVVDNASNDNTRELAADFSDVILLPQTSNTGFGVGNNTGMAYALRHGADYVFLLNADATIEPPTIERLVEVAREHPDYGIISPMQCSDETQTLDYLFSRHLVRKNNPSFMQLMSDLYRGRAANIYEVSFVNAAAWLVSRWCLETIGGFDPIFSPAYGEDDDLINRAKYHQLKIGVVPSARVYHYRTQGSLEARIQTRRQAIQLASHQMILQVANPTRSLSTGLVDWLTDFPVNVVRFLFKGRWRQLGVYLAAFAATASKLSTILRHRKQALSEGPHWMAIEDTLT